MLRRIRLKNFVHFIDEQDVRLENGSNFCIGQNGSGKSAIFEAIRRCMSTSKNMGISSSHDSELPSIAACYFDFSADGLDGDEMEVVEEAHSRKPEDLVISCIVRLRGSSSAKCATFKLVFDKSRNKLYIDRQNMDENDLVVNVGVTLDQAEEDTLKQVFSNEDFGIDELFSVIDGLVNIHSPVRNEYRENTLCERFLKEFVDERVVITYPMRSIAPVQWTKSTKLSPTQGMAVRKEIQERAEIICWYFDQDNDANNYRTRVQEYFDIITDNCPVRFQRDPQNGEIYGIEAEGTPNRLGIEKIPEGYYEAMNCAIILAYPGFKTVCLEEPGRGMHPQMVERLRDLVLQTKVDKTVLITSHKPAFVASWNIPRMFFFKKDREGNKVIRLKIISGKKLLDDDQESDDAQQPSSSMEGEKTMRITTNRHFSTLYFARRVLFVEGEGDFRFLEELKLILLKDKSNRLLEAALRKAIESERSEVTFDPGLISEFRRYLWPLHILDLRGEPNKSKLEKVCRILDIERYFVLDYDAVTDDQKGASGEDKFTHFVHDFALERRSGGEDPSRIEDEIRKDINYLEDFRIFAWTNKRVKENGMPKGTIETALRDFHYLTDGMQNLTDLKSVLEKNKVTLQWDETKKEKHRNKLFTNKYLTDENVHNVVDAVLERCQMGQNSEFFRLVVFFCRMFLRKRPRTRSSSGANTTTTIYERQPATK